MSRMLLPAWLSALWAWSLRSPIVLRPRYAVSVLTGLIVLPLCYAVSGTEGAYAATRRRCSACPRTRLSSRLLS
eukprot:645850-Rhodomonas_salina.1